MTTIRKCFRPFSVLLMTAAVACSSTDSSSDTEAVAAGSDLPSQAMPSPAAQPDMQGVDGLLDPNATAEPTLAEVPHVTDEIARQLAAGRPFADMLEVDALLAGSLDGMQREEVYTHVFVPLDLNSASEAEILLIPGVGDRMAHEFEEYRPYIGIEQFRREIGKYVDEAEVARLEQYVRIP